SPHLLAAFFIASGVNHFVMGRAYCQIVPPRLQARARMVVHLSGVAEVLGGAAVLLPRTRRHAGVGLVALLAAVFPANLYMARAPARCGRSPGGARSGRRPLQPLMMWWAGGATRR